MAVILKAREIRERLQGKIDPVIIDILCRQAEEHKQHNDHVHQLAHAYDRLANMVTDMIMATGKIAESQTSIVQRLGLGGQSGKGLGIDVSSIEAQDDDSRSTQ